MCFLLVATLIARKLLYLGVLQEVMQGGHAENPYPRDKLKRVQEQSWTRNLTDLKPEARRKTDLKPEAVVHKQTWNRKLWYTNRLKARSCCTQTDLIPEDVLLKQSWYRKLHCTKTFKNRKLLFTNWSEPKAVTVMHEQTWYRNQRCTNRPNTGSCIAQTRLKPETFVHTLVWTGSCDARTDLTPEPVVNKQTWNRKLHCKNTLETGSFCSHTGQNTGHSKSCSKLGLGNKKSRFNKTLNHVRLYFRLFFQKAVLKICLTRKGKDFNKI